MVGLAGAVARVRSVLGLGPVLRLGLAAFVLAAGLGAAQPAAAADPSLQVRISGPTSIDCWDARIWTIRVTNPHAFPVSAVAVDVFDTLLPIAYNGILASTGRTILRGERVAY